MTNFDAYTLIVSKFQDHESIPLTDVEIRELRNKFQYVRPWNNFIKQRVYCKFELVGIPLQCWNDETIKEIGGLLGEVEEICYKRKAFLSVEVLVKTELNNPNHRTLNFVNVIASGMPYRVLVREVMFNQCADSAATDDLSLEIDGSSSKDKRDDVNHDNATLIEL